MGGCKNFDINGWVRHNGGGGEGRNPKINYLMFGGGGGEYSKN